MPEEMRQMVARLAESMEFHEMLQEYGGFGERFADEDGDAANGERERGGGPRFGGPMYMAWDSSPDVSEDEEERERGGGHPWEETGMPMLEGEEEEEEADEDEEEMPPLTHSDSDRQMRSDDESDDDDDDDHKGNQEFLPRGLGFGSGKGFGKGIC
jgi:hypothetical protein